MTLRHEPGNTVPFPAVDAAQEQRKRALASARLPARLPPLNLFRTFDAAARHNSFRLAADELCVTPSAVSQQIRQLEEFLDIRLFRRLTRRVELTSEGGALAGTVQEVLAMLTASCEKLRDPSTPAVVCINAMPAIAIRWLVSRLKAFMEADEQIKLSLLASSDPLDFERQDVDLGVRWGNGSFPGMRAERLAADRMVAVCSPEMAERARTPDDLRLLPLLQAQGGVAWTRWFEAAGVAGKPAAESVFFNEFSLLLEAAACGQGVALASSLLVESDLRSGRLVRLFDVAAPAEEGFYILSSETLGDKPAIARVREWLQAEARGSIEATAKLGFSEGTLHPFPR
ncbi:transcriptional regulator GcvA [Aureimonas populi]|uniref:Transcriptional regulator GcvA n=1 Tax=Aureimonas populi TaxID=1701758 RepID=A0ABW5CLP2_9HYPH|nr:transcriptional regulator GcvA [Aureimonas populi]